MSVETPEFGKAVKRMLRAYGRRVADADDVDLAELAAMRDVVDQVIGHAVAGQRARGASWSEIGRALGVSKQTAHERYRDVPIDKSA